ncbi:uncharacterized protein [Macaca nemestrina]|uniref:uncharacterized protein isoform X4 n=1 Tax=Macaca nemestrina TaxID=9545 RepID=UPI0039B895B7
MAQRARAEGAPLERRLPGTSQAARLGWKTQTPGPSPSWGVGQMLVDSSAWCPEMAAAAEGILTKPTSWGLRQRLLTSHSSEPGSLRSGPIS